MSMPSFRSNLPRFSSIALSLLLQTQLCCAFAADVVGLDSACKLYAAGKVQECAKLVDGFLAKSPKDPSAHYLKANCLVKLKKLPDAIHEYALVEHFAPNTKLAAQAKSAGAKLELFQLQSSAKVSGEQNGGKVNPKHLPPGTIDLIRKQAVQARNRAIEMGQAEAGNEVSKAANQAKAELDRAERMAQGAQHRGDVTGASGYDAELARNRAQANADQLKQNGEIRAAWKEQEAREKAEILERQAEELEEQLVNDRPYKNRSVKLNPVGTNLYTRNYSSAKPPIKQLDAQAYTLPGDAGMRRTSATVNGKPGSAPNAVSGRYRAGTGTTSAEAKVKGLVVPR
ncbi:MAG: hypothetical protein SGJ27_30470 [Candidatus Melainabacteria bacterium]|nr:hypothetical protein [Candidatus Melainabacteria bacterium]